MIVPSSRLRTLITGTMSGIWFEAVRAPPDERQEALFVKMHSPVIKSVYLGCAIRIFIGRMAINHSHVLCLAVAFYDIPEDPFYLYRAITNPRDVSLLNRLLSSDSPLRFYFYDDTSQLALTLNCTLNRDHSSRALHSIVRPESWLATGDHIEFDAALVAFMELVSGCVVDSLGQVQEIDITESDRRIPEIFTREMFGGNLPGTMINNPDEGGALEQQVCRQLYYVFGNRTVRSPRLVCHSVKRELTDVLVTDDDLVMAFECKAAAVLAREVAAPATKRAKLLQQQISKGLKQLRGVVRQLRQGAELSTAAGERINLTVSPRIVAICLVSNMEPDCDWKSVYNEIMSAENTSNVSFQVLDLKQLDIMTSSSPTPSIFIQMLKSRWESMHATESAYVKPSYFCPVAKDARGAR